MAGPIERIAVVRANNVGDFVVATPALRALRAAHPDAEITYVGAPATRPLAERLDWLIDRTVDFPGFPGIREREFEASSTIRFLAAEQRRRYDLAIQLHGNGVWSSPFTALLGARMTAGFVRAEDSPHFLGLDRWLVHDPDRHEILRLLDLLETIGIPDQGTDLELSLRPDDEAEADELLQGARPRVRQARKDERSLPEPFLLAVHAGGRFVERMWPPDRFADAIEPLLDRYGGSAVILGSAADRAQTEPLVARLGGRAIDLRERTSLPVLAAVIARSSLFLGNDSGPAHIAVAVDTPSVTVFGAASPDVWGPLDRRTHAAVAADDACHPCGPEPCILRVRPDAVVDAAERVLAARRLGGPGRDPRPSIRGADWRDPHRVPA